MLRTWPVLDVEIEFFQKQHPPGQFPCQRLFGDEVEERHVVHVQCELFASYVMAELVDAVDPVPLWNNSSLRWTTFDLTNIQVDTNWVSYAA